VKSRDPVVDRRVVTRLVEDVKELHKTVYQGNGKPSLVTQVTALDASVKNLESNVNTKMDALNTEMGLRIVDMTNLITERFKHLETRISYEFEQKKAGVEGTWKYRTAIMTAIITGILGLLALSQPMLHSKFVAPAAATINK
jgi:glutamine synthetase type III